MKVIREDNKLILRLENKKEQLHNYKKNLDTLIEDLYMNDIYIVFDSAIYYVDAHTLKVYYNTFYFSSIALDQELNHLLFLLENSNELELTELDEFEYTDLAQEEYLQDEILIDALKYNVNKNTVLERVLKQSDLTLKDLIIFIVVDKSTLEDILNDYDIQLTMFERFDLKDDLYNAIMISDL